MWGNNYVIGTETLLANSNFSVSLLYAEARLL